MKLKTLAIVGLVAAVLTIAVVVLIRQRPMWSRAVVGAKRYQHQHLSPSEWEPTAKLNAIEYTLRSGETLEGIATERYGHWYYSRVIKLYNKLEDETKLETGTNLRLPDISVILAEEGVTKVASAEVEQILCSRARYAKVVGQLRALDSRSPANHVLSEDVQRGLLEAADDLQLATEGLKVSRPGVGKVPERMIGQLEQSMTLLKTLAKGEHDQYGYDIDLVQQHYALALIYAIIWARDGFK